MTVYVCAAAQDGLVSKWLDEWHAVNERKHKEARVLAEQAGQQVRCLRVACVLA
jgi:hypothetical protein